MKRLKTILLLGILSLHTSFCSDSGTDTKTETNTIVKHFGKLSVDGKNLVDQNGDTLVLRGMSLFWSQWGGQYYNHETIKWLRDDWKCTIIRAAVGVESGGYLENELPELAKLYTVIDACIDLGIYVIVDWHDHQAEDHQDEALEFFRTVSNKYGDYDNIIYELYNEPLDVSWNDVLMPYADTLIAEIRKNDPDNLVIVGTPNWSQDVDAVTGNTLEDNNVAYTLHFYTSTHGQWLRDKAITAMTNDIPVFVTEWGLSEASGTGEIDPEASVVWMDFLDHYRLSWCNWSVINKDESSAAFLPSTTALSGWAEGDLTESGKIIRNYLIEKNAEIFENIE